MREHPTMPQMHTFISGAPHYQRNPFHLKGIIRVSKLQGIDLFYYLLDLRELANSNDMHKSLVAALF